MQSLRPGRGFFSILGRFPGNQRMRGRGRGKKIRIHTGVQNANEGSRRKNREQVQLHIPVFQPVFHADGISGSGSIG